VEVIIANAMVELYCMRACMHVCVYMCVYPTKVEIDSSAHDFPLTL